MRSCNSYSSLHGINCISVGFNIFVAFHAVLQTILEANFDCILVGKCSDSNTYLDNQDYSQES